ncbi:hypothetical protein MARHY1855 [Marinobacter nauticus ATCC 49840]|nr:hypothetical protein MARHY1855 [Marinobacter nauticus ATCC 49840]
MGEQEFLGVVTVGTTQPATFARTVYSGFGSKLSHPGPQLPVDGEVSKGRTIYPITRRAVSIDIERLTVQVVGTGSQPSISGVIPFGTASLYICFCMAGR